MQFSGERYAAPDSLAPGRTSLVRPLQKEALLAAQSPDFAFGRFRSRLQRFRWFDRVAAELLQPGDHGLTRLIAAASIGFIESRPGHSVHLRIRISLLD